MKQSGRVLIPGNETRYGLAEASRITAVPTSRFRYAPNKERLIAAGATVDSSGWSIPVSALEALGWKSNAGDVNTPPNTKTKPGVKRGIKNDQSELLEQLRSENTYLREQLSVQTQTAADLSRAHALISAQLASLEPMQMQTDSGTTDTARSSGSWFSRWKRPSS